MTAMAMRLVRDAGGAVRHVPTLALVPAAKAKKKKRPAPDPIKTNGDSAAEKLRLLIEGIEADNAVIAEAQEARRERIAEAGSTGYDTKALLAIIARRKKDKAILDEEEAILDTYLQSLGML